TSHIRVGRKCRSIFRRGPIFSMNEAAIFKDIVAALSGGNPVEAERLSHTVLADSPEHIDAMLALAMSLHAQRRTDDAIAAFLRLTQVQPARPVHWGN